MRFKKGRGDINSFIKQLEESKSTHTLEKIDMIYTSEYNGKPTFSDSNPEKVIQNQKGLSQKKVFSLWRN